MTPLEIEYITKVVGSNQKQFYYFRDKYALQILRYHVKEHVRINELRNSTFRNLLDKEPVREMMGVAGSGSIRSGALDNYLPAEGRVFNYTLSKWGEYVQHRNDDWYQTTRPGLSLVLQLNFDSWHNYKYHQWIRKCDEDNPFEFDCHPIAETRNYTMSWCRVDINLDSGEALIEEIQNDWLREVQGLKCMLAKHLEKPEKKRLGHWFFSRYNLTDFQKYCTYIEYYQRIWPEATLSLAIHFLKQEMGLDTIYYHDFDSGNHLKKIMHIKPPKSLYTKLPKKFGFDVTTEAPNFLKKVKYLKKKLRNKDLRWWILKL